MSPDSGTSLLPADRAIHAPAKVEVVVQEIPDGVQADNANDRRRQHLPLPVFHAPDRSRGNEHRKHRQRKRKSTQRLEVGHAPAAEAAATRPCLFSYHAHNLCARGKRVNRAGRCPTPGTATRTTLGITTVQQMKRNRRLTCGICPPDPNDPIDLPPRR